MSTDAEAIRRVINRLGSLTVTGTPGYADVKAAGADLDALLAENEQLRAALKAMREVASVAHNGDPWYCENEGVDAAAAFKSAGEALGEAVRG